MSKTTRILSAVVVVAAMAAVAAPVSANGLARATGTVSPASVAAGGELTVTFEASGNTAQCDDVGPDNGQYADRPLVFGLFPTSVALDGTGGWPTAWYLGGTPLATLGFVTSPGTLATSAYDGGLGWTGSFTGQVTVPTDLEPGDYNAVWSCGDPEDPQAYDAGGYAVVQAVTVTSDSPVPEPTVDGISLSLDFAVGDNVRTGTLGVPVSGGGLKPGANYTVVLRSDPVEIGAGVNDADGRFSAVYPLPADTPAGSHSVTVTSLNPADTEVSAVAWFTVDDNGIVTAISYEGPTAAATAATPRFTG